MLKYLRHWLDEGYFIPTLCIPLVLIVMLLLCFSLYKTFHTDECALVCAPADYKQVGDLCFCRTDQVPPPWRLASPK